MALEVGSVFARVGARFDDDGFDRFDRRLDSARKAARSPVEARAGVDVNERGFRRYEQRLDGARRDSRRPVEAEGRMDVNERGFRKFRQETAAAERAASHSGKRSGMAFGAVGGAASKMAGGVGIAAGIAGGAVAVMAKGMIEDATAIGESLSKNRVLFGDFAGDVEEFSKTSAKNFGISRTAALEYTGVFGNLARAAGIGQKDAAGLSVRLTKLAADLASFNNTSIEDALDALRSGLVGETEPLRRFGITLSANAVAAEAMRSGIVKVKKSSLEYRTAAIAVEKAERARTKAIKEHGPASLQAREASVALEKANKEMTKAAAGGKVELTNQQKAIATTNLVMRQSKNANGDFARTQNSLANQTRIVNARFADARVEMGQKLLPVALKITRAANKLFDEWERGEGTGGTLRKVVAAVGRELKSFGHWLQEASSDIREWQIDAIRAADKVLGVFEAISRAGAAIGIPGQKKAVRDIREMRESMGAYRRELERANKESGRVSNIKEQRRELDRLDSKLGTLKKGTKEYRETAESLRKKQRQLNDALGDAKKDGDKGAKGLTAINTSARRAARAVIDSTGDITESYNALAKELGIKPLSLKTRRRIAATGHDVGITSDGKQRGGRAGYQAGGILPGTGREDTVPVWAAPGEAFLTRWHQPAVEEGLALRSMFLGGPGSLDDLFASVTRPHGSGAAPAGFARGGMVRIPGDPDTTGGRDRVAASIAGEVGAFLRRFGVQVGYGYDPGGGHKSPGHNVTGTAIDIHPGRTGWDGVDKAAAAAVRAGKTAYYDGRFGTINLPPHGRGHHLHVEWATGGNVAGAVDFPRFSVEGPAGFLRTAANRAVGRLGRGAAGKIESALGDPGVAGAHGPDAGGLSRAQVLSLAGRALARTGLFPNTPANRGALADRAYQESGYRPGVTQGVVDVNTGGNEAVGLMQIVPGTFATYRDPRLPNDRRNPFASMVAAVRYMKAKYGRIMGGTGKGYQRGGIVGFQRGGKAGKRKRPSITGGALRELGLSGEASLTGAGSGAAHYQDLRRTTTDYVGDYDDALADVERLQGDYSYLDRRYGQSDEELVDEETGAVNVGAVKARGAELTRLLEIRRRIRQRLKDARDTIERTVRSYTTMLKRLRAARRAVRGKRKFVRQRRAYYDRLIKHYGARRAEWTGKRREALTSWRDSGLDVTDTESELAGVLGTTARPQAEPEAAEPDTAAAADTAAADTADPAEAAPTPLQLAEGVAQALEAFNTNRGELFEQFGSNFMRSPGGDELTGAAGARYYGATGAAIGFEHGTGGGVGLTAGTDQSTLGGATVNNYFAAPPPDPHNWTRDVVAELNAL